MQRERREQRRKISRVRRALDRASAINERRRFALQRGVAFDHQLGRHQLVLPEVLSLSTNYEATASALAEIREIALRQGRRVLLHFQHVRSIEPAAALALVSEIYRVRNIRSLDAVSGTYPASPDVYSALRDMGFFRLLSILDRRDAPEKVVDGHKPVYLQFLTNNRADWGLVDRFVSVVEKLITFNELARQRLVKAIGEAINNTLDHAHPVEIANDPMKNRWWLGAWVNVANREVAVIIHDKGVGIPKTLPPTDYEQIRAFINNLAKFRLSTTPSDGETILAATEYHRSGTGSGERGRGFYDMKQFIEVCSDGELRVLSNRGSYHYMRGREHYGNNDASIGGTLIEWRFRHDDGVVELKDE